MARICAKSLLVGALSGVLSMVLGCAVAHAECSQGSREVAAWDAYEGTQRGLRCEVIELENGAYEAQCDDPADESVRACEAFSADYGPDVDMAYEACMTVALHTPGAVRL